MPVCPDCDDFKGCTTGGKWFRAAPCTMLAIAFDFNSPDISSSHLESGVRTMSSESTAEVDLNAAKTSSELLVAKTYDALS